MGAIPQTSAPSLLEQAVDAACSVLNTSDEVEALELVTNRHPAYGELLRLRSCVERHDLKMSVAGGGVVMVLRKAGVRSGNRSGRGEGDRG